MPEGLRRRFYPVRSEPESAPAQEWVRVTTDDHHVTTITVKAPLESTGGAFSCPGIVTGDDVAIVI